MKKLLILPILALLLAACTDSAKLAPQAEQFSEVPLTEAYIAHAVLRTKTHAISLHNIEVPATTEFWQVDANGEWAPIIERIKEALGTSGEIPSEYEGEAVIGEYALFQSVDPGPQEGSDQSSYPFLTQQQLDQIISSCWGSTPYGMTDAGCYEGRLECQVYSPTSFTLWCIL